MTQHIEQLEMFPLSKEEVLLGEMDKMRNQIGGLFKRINLLEKELIDLVYQMRDRVEFTESRMR